MTCEVIQGNAVACVKNRIVLPSRFTCMIVDPPYSRHVHRNATSQSAKGGTRHRDLGFDHLSPELRRCIAYCAGQVERWSLVYSDIEGLHNWRKEMYELGSSYIRAMPWVRWSMPQLSGDRPPQGFELVTAYWGRERGRKSWNGPGNLTHLAHTCLRGEDKHKCEKPLDQALDLVSWFSNVGDSVLDPCAGSGTIGLACKLLNRGYVGIEIDPEWAESAKERIAESQILSDRDDESYERWKESQKAFLAGKEKRAAHTAKIRAKLDALKGERDGT